ncbi:MAG: PilZ domain-containing protein [Phycisphaerales bacterium]
MNTWQALEAIRRSQAEQNADNRRHSPRFNCTDALCGTKGRVLDVSKTGLRVRSRKRPSKGTATLLLDSPGARLRVEVEVAWVVKAGREYEIGYRLMNPEAAKEAGLFKLAYSPCPDSVFLRTA